MLPAVFIISFFTRAIISSRNVLDALGAFFAKELIDRFSPQWYSPIEDTYRL
jgi:hypothetical protein